MQTFKRDGGDPMGIRPTHLVVDPANEAAARKILETQLIRSEGFHIPPFRAQLRYETLSLTTA
jgi:phage major head subunit gpT-like protein